MHIVSSFVPKYICLLNACPKIPPHATFPKHMQAGSLYPSAESNHNTSSYEHDSGSHTLRPKKEEIIFHFAESLCYAKLSKIIATETNHALEIVRKQQGGGRGVTSITVSIN